MKSRFVFPNYEREILFLLSSVFKNFYDLPKDFHKFSDKKVSVKMGYAPPLFGM